MRLIGLGLCDPVDIQVEEPALIFVRVRALGLQIEAFLRDGGGGELVRSHLVVDVRHVPLLLLDLTVAGSGGEKGAGGGNFSLATEITPENVSQLRQAWVHRSGDYHQGNEWTKERSEQKKVMKLIAWLAVGGSGRWFVDVKCFGPLFLDCH